MKNFLFLAKIPNNSGQKSDNLSRIFKNNGNYIPVFDRMRIKYPQSQN